MSARYDDTIVGVNIPQHITRNFLNHVGIRWVRGKQRDIVSKARAHGLQATDLEFNEIRPPG